MSEHDRDWILKSLSCAFDGSEFREAELGERLNESVDLARRVFGVAGAGVVLIDERERLDLMGASDETARALECIQREVGEGPGMQTVRTQQVVAVRDLANDSRWPAVSHSVGRIAIGGVLSVPVGLQGRPVGNLNLFDVMPRAWTAADADRARCLAAVVQTWLAVAVDAHRRGRRVAQLLDALGCCPSDGLS